MKNFDLGEINNRKKYLEVEKNNKNNYIDNIRLDTSSVVENIIICPNCDMYYNSDVGCLNCGYGGVEDFNFDRRLFSRIEKEINKELKIEKLKEKNKGNGKKIKLADNLYFYNYHGRIKNGKAEIDLLVNGDIKNKKERIKVFLNYEVSKNNTAVGEAEAKTVKHMNIYKLKIYRNKKWLDLDLNKNMKVLEVNNFGGKSIKQIIFTKILLDYKYDSDLLFD